MQARSEVQSPAHSFIVQKPIIPTIVWAEESLESQLFMLLLHRMDHETVQNKMQKAQYKHRPA
jgi:hypothetical protein